MGSRNITNKIEDVLKITNDAFDSISAKDWENSCKHVERVENDYREKDVIIDEEIDKIVIHLGESSSESEEDWFKKNLNITLKKKFLNIFF